MRLFWLKYKILFFIFVLLAVLLGAGYFIKNNKRRNELRSSNQVYVNLSRDYNLLEPFSFFSNPSENITLLVKNKCSELYKKSFFIKGYDKEGNLVKNESEYTVWLSSMYHQSNEKNLCSAIALKNIAYFKNNRSASYKALSDASRNILISLAKNNDKLATVFLCSGEYELSTDDGYHLCLEKFSDASIPWKEAGITAFIARFMSPLSMTDERAAFCLSNERNKILKSLSRFNTVLGNIEVAMYNSCCYAAMKDIGANYYFGIGVKVSYSKALVFLLNSNPEDDSSGGSQYLIGSIYLNRDNSIENINKAIYWLLESYKHGGASVFPDIENDLGYLYSQLGELRLAFQWVEQAAYSNDAQAQWNLAKMYAHGRGVIQDISKAYAWASIAALNGISDQESLNYRAQQVDLENFRNQLGLMLSLSDKSGMALKKAKSMAQNYLNQITNKK